MLRQNPLDEGPSGRGALRGVDWLGVVQRRATSMRNLLDTASIAQSLDGERLTGRLHYPRRIIFSDLVDYK
jgi:hypothetical protein